MDTFEERQKAFENKFKYDQDVMFQINSRRAKLVGLWAAEKLNVIDPDGYALNLVQTDVEEGMNAALIRQLQEDFKANNKSISLHRIEKEMIKQLEIARQQITQSV